MPDQSTDQPAEPTADADPAPDRVPAPRSRRSFLGVAAAALGAVAAQTVASTLPVDAATGSTMKAGLVNTATSTTTVKATKAGIAAMRGYAANATEARFTVGVLGQADANMGIGVRGVADGGIRTAGVMGTSASGAGVVGLSGTDVNVDFRDVPQTVADSGVSGVSYADEGYGVAGFANSPAGNGVYGSGGTNGVHGVAARNNGTGVRGEAHQGSAAWGVGGISSSGQGVHGESTAVGNAGVYGTNTGATNGVGVAGRGNASNGYGAQGFGNIGVYGEGTGSGGIGIKGVASGSATVAGSFSGNVQVVGTLSKSAGSFVIDHPLDPENRYLAHSFVESPEMLNVYSGTVTLDSKGRATVRLPRYFEALNMEHRYQLTAIGRPAPELHIAKKIQGNRFAIAGGAAGQEVCWLITGVRQDAYAQQHRIKVDTPKKAKDKGRYLNPEAFGKRRTDGISHQKTPRIARLKGALTRRDP